MLLVYGIAVDQNYLRFEITLHTPDKIEQKLQTNSIWTLQDNNIQKYFHQFVADNIEKPFRVPKDLKGNTKKYEIITKERMQRIKEVRSFRNVASRDYSPFVCNDKAKYDELIDKLL